MKEEKTIFKPLAGIELIYFPIYLRCLSLHQYNQLSTLSPKQSLRRRTTVKNVSSKILFITVKTYKFIKLFFTKTPTQHPIIFTIISINNNILNTNGQHTLHVKLNKVKFGFKAQEIKEFLDLFSEFS